MMILGDVGVGKTSVFTSFIGHNPNELNEEGDPATGQRISIVRSIENTIRSDVMSHFVQSQPKRFKSEEGVELSVVVRLLCPACQGDFDRGRLDMAPTFLAATTDSSMSL